MTPTIVTAAVVGSRPTKEDNSAVPYSPREIADAALACGRAGAAIAHIHVRNPKTGEPASDIALFRQVVERIRGQSDMLINLTTSGLDIRADTEEELIDRRLEPVQLAPDICSLDIGSVNFSDRTFVNSPRFVETAARRMMAAGVKPELELFDVGHASQARHLVQKGLFRSPAWFQLCMGVPWGIPATPAHLLLMRDQLPDDCLWSVLGVGRHQLPMITLSVLLGGHVRVGFEDNLYRRKGELARDNAQLVEMAVNVLHALDKTPATPAQARSMLAI